MPLKNNIQYIFVLCLFLAVTLAVGSAHAQAYQPERKGLQQNWRINLNAGSSIFYGDLKDEGILPYDIDYRLGYGFIIRKQLSAVFGIGGQIYNSKIKSTEKYIEEGIEKAITFEADVFEYNLHLIFDFIPMFNGYSPEHKTSAYMFLGWGLSNWKTIVKDYNTDETIRAHGFTGKGPGKRTTELVMPVGLGLRYNVNNKLGITFETALHPVNSDFLDATDGGFSYDMYHYTSLGISFFLNGSSTDKDRSREIVRIKKRQARRKSRQSNAENYNEPARYYYQDIQKQEPIEQENIEVETRADISDFKKKYAESDLPVVSEYNFKGVFGRNSRKVAIRSAEKPVLPDQEITTSGSRTLTFKSAKSRTPDNKAANDEQSDVTGIIYGVQILAGRKEADIKSLSKKYNIEEQIKAYRENGLIRYVVIPFPTYNSAAAYAKILQGRGISDAFVVAYRNGKRVRIKKGN